MDRSAQSFEKAEKVMKWFLMILPFLLGILGLATLAYAFFYPGIVGDKAVWYAFLGAIFVFIGWIGCGLVSDDR